MKRVLVISFSQTGQLEAVVRSFVAPLQSDPTISVRRIQLEPVERYPFPWPLVRFFDLFPECVYLDPAPIMPIRVASEEDYDLAIIAYQVWFLSPSMPVTAFLKSETARRLLADKPVITVVACRNMWAMAHEKMKSLLAGVGARLIDNVVLTDRGGFSTFITTPIWMLTGRKGGFFGLSAAGIAREDIQACDRFGHALVSGLAADQERQGKPMLAGLRAVVADPGLISMERMGDFSFRMWGCVLRTAGAPGSRWRAALVVVFAIYLTLIIVALVPMSMLVRQLLSPLFARRRAADRAYFEWPSGSSDHRISR
jgi:hypothetical protein